MAKKSVRAPEPEALCETWEVETNRKWTTFVGGLMPSICPDMIEWQRQEEIIAVLDRLTRELRDGHYTFLPGGGGLEVTGVDKGWEPGCIQLEINDGDYRYVCLAASLLCVVFPRSPQFCYFDLQLGELTPRDPETEPGAIKEDICGRIRTVRRHKVGNRTVEIPSRRWAAYTRLLRGRIVIFSKVSLYNLESQTTDGRHHVMSREQFRQYIQGAVNCGPFGAEQYLASSDSV